MKYNLSKYRMTIPQEIRDKAGFKSPDEKIDIVYDEYLDCIIVRKLTKDEVINDIIEKTVQDANEHTEERKLDSSNIINNKKSAHRPNNSNKIEANFMDADKLSRACFSECGLVCRTKNSYLKKFCDRCKGQLALEWEDKADVKCSYLENEVNSEINTLNDNKSSIKDDISNIREQRKNDIQNITNSIKEANKVLDNNINKLTKRRGRPRKYNKKDTEDDTTLMPVKSSEYNQCSICGEFFKSGFLVNDEFRCKECTKNDFKKYLEKRGK